MKQACFGPLYFLFDTCYLYINSGRWYLCHVPSTFATVNTHANMFFVFLPAGISKECRHIVSANCDFEGNLPGQYQVFTGLSGNTFISHVNSMGDCDGVKQSERQWSFPVTDFHVISMISP